MEMSLTHTDIRGVERGRCMDADCDCDEFIVEQDDNGRVCRVMCCYCDHAPAKHSTLTSLAGNLESRSLSAGSVQHQSDGVAVPQAQWNLESRSPPAVSAEYQRNSVAVPEAQCTSENVDTYQPSKELQGSSSGQGQHDLEPSLHNEDNANHSISWSPETLPHFSGYLKPLLEGKEMSQKQHKHQSIQLRHEIIRHLDSNNLIMSGSMAKMRWEYNALGAALAKSYPYMVWENASPAIKTYKKSKEVWSVFMHRLSTSRKQRRYRKRHAISDGAENPAAEHQEECDTLTMEQAVEELTVLCGMPADELDDHESRMPQLLKVTLLFRKDNPPETLPNYFLREHTLAHEAELRFGLAIGETEKLLYAVKAAFAEVTNEEPSYLAIDKYLKSRHTQQKLVMNACNPQMQKPLGPAIVFGEDKWVYGGSYDERILLNEECTLERALVMCLTIYYIKDLSYPLAYGQILLLLQRIVVKDSVPKACMNGKLKDFITRLEKKHII